MFTPREIEIEEIKFNGEDNIHITDKDGWSWSGMKRKDLFNSDDDWENLLVVGTKLRQWTIQFSRVIGVEYWNGKEWDALWVQGNDFQTKAERKKAEDGYVNFIEEEGKLIATLIDKGETLSEIDEHISKDHSGNTYGWALNLGIRDAKDRDKAESIKREHNAKYGKADADGVVNPAIVNIKM